MERARIVTVRPFRDAAGEYRFAIDGANGENLATSEGYTRAADAERGFDALADVVIAGRVVLSHPEAVALREFLDAIADGCVPADWGFVEGIYDRLPPKP